jgi:hypothetical protein
MVIVYGTRDRHRDMIDTPGNEPGVSTRAVTGGGRRKPTKEEGKCDPGNAGLPQRMSW